MNSYHVTYYWKDIDSKAVERDHGLVYAWTEDQALERVLDRNYAYVDHPNDRKWIKFNLRAREQC